MMCCLPGRAESRRYVDSIFSPRGRVAKRYGEGKRIQNTFQTNGILLSDEWCRFLRDNGWLVGISLDGPADLHDAYRVSRSGKPTHHKVVEAIARLVAHRVDFNLLVVVNRLNSQQPARMYRYLRQLGTPFLQFIPLVERDDSGKLTADSVTSEDWGVFSMMCLISGFGKILGAFLYNCLIRCWACGAGIRHKCARLAKPAVTRSPWKQTAISISAITMSTRRSGWVISIKRHYIC